MKKQIEEMVKSFIDGKDVPSGADCRLCLFDRDTLYIKVAEALYNAGYRKQKHGTWYHGTENGAVYAKCSACGRKMNYSCYGYAYCSLCGARMDGAKMKGGAE